MPRTGRRPEQASFDEGLWQKRQGKNVGGV